MKYPFLLLSPVRMIRTLRQMKSVCLARLDNDRGFRMERLRSDDGTLTSSSNYVSCSRMVRTLRNRVSVRRATLKMFVGSKTVGTGMPLLLGTGPVRSSLEFPSRRILLQEEKSSSSSKPCGM